MQSICDDLEAETAEIITLLSALTAEGWDRPTPADGWSIRDTISHLAFFDETGTLAATDAEAFAANTREMMALPEPMSLSLNRGRAMEGAEVLDWFIRARTNMVQVFRGLNAKARLPWYGPAMGALSFATARLMETWAHGQDVVDTLGASREPTDRLRHVAHIGVRARAFSYAANHRSVPEGEVTVLLTGPSGDRWTWNEKDNNENVVSGDALDFCLVVVQRRHLADTRLRVTGPLATDWMSIAQAFAGAPGPGRSPGQFK